MVQIKINIIIIFVLTVLHGCDDRAKDADNAQRKMDILVEHRIDSAYEAIAAECDSMLINKVPEWAVSLAEKDSTSMHVFFTTERQLYNDTNKKIEKVVRQLKKECDSNLLKETYKRALQLQQLKPR